MATSSITHNFIISGQENVERFLDAIEESYQESLHRKPEKKLNFRVLEGEEAIEFIKERERLYGKGTHSSKHS